MSGIMSNQQLKITLLIGSMLVLLYLVLNNLPGFYCETSTLPLATEIRDIHKIENVFEDRRRRVFERCKQVNETVKYSGFEKNNLLFDRSHFIGFCHIGKVSSTFWKRVLTVMGSNGKIKSPFEVRGQDISLPTGKLLSQSERERIKNHGTFFMFVRDPYTRLLSAYEDKFYRPGIRYWSTEAMKIIQVIRTNNNTPHQTYGFDVTFPEFVKYILYLYDKGKTINGHFNQMYHQCHPCSIQYHYIGKLETIKDDAMYLISKWRQEFKDFNLHFDDFEQENIMDTAKGRVSSVFQVKEVMGDINFPFNKLLLRTWRDLQLRGYLSKSIDFPIKEKDADRITQSKFLELIKIALNSTVNRTEVKLQREEAFIQAYRQISQEDMEKLRKYVLQDCQLFGYDDRPKKLFDRSRSVNIDFNYFDGLK